MPARRPALVLLASLPLLLLTVGPLPTSAAAPPPAPSLATETFVEYALEELEDQPCDPDGSQTIEFHLAGDAAGPYVGTYTHDGSAVLGAPDAAGLREVLSYEATFRIDAGDTVVTGTMTQDPSFQGARVARCSRTTTSEGGRAVIVRLSTTADYDAVIRTGAESYRDAGTVYNGLTYESYTDPCCSGTNQGASSNFFGGDDPTDPGPATTLTLSPAAAVNEVGTSHTVTASATDVLGRAVPSTRVLVTVRGSTTTSGSCTTGADGTCTVTYAGPELPGADAITACADTNGNGACDPGEPSAEATKAWVLPTSTTGKVTGGGQVPAATDPHGKVAFGFQAKTKDGQPTGTCQVVDQTPDANLLVKCLDVTAMTVSGNHATLFGTATVNGQPTTYRIDVDDLGEPGQGIDTFRIRTASGHTVSGTLVAGNVQTR